MSAPAVHFAQPSVDLLLNVQNVQLHLLLCDFHLVLQLLQQRLTVASICWRL